MNLQKKEYPSFGLTAQIQPKLYLTESGIQILI